MAHRKLHIGTSGWSYKDWLGVFYPQGTQSKEYLSYYSSRFATVEIDSTFYGIPRPSTVKNWYHQTPEHFIFSPKVPRIITHDKRLEQADAEWNQFLQTMAILKHKLGPVVLQFDYTFSFKEHFSLLQKFLERHHDEARLCVEIRNRNWHNTGFYDVLRSYNVALVLNDIYYMPRVIELTADFTYIRLLGNRKLVPDDFTHVRIDRSKDLDWWAQRIEKILDKELEVYAYSNNRYQGFAPETVESITACINKHS